MVINATSRSRNWVRFLNPTWVSAGILLISAFIIFQPIVAFLVHEEVDYANHLSYLKRTMDLEVLGEVLSMFPHFLYHLLVYLVFKLFSLTSFFDSALAVSLFAYLLGTLATFWLITRFLGTPTTYTQGAVYTAVTLALMLLMPINIFTPDNLFVGYIGVNAYHNPTIVLLKPAAILVFWCAGSVFQTPYKSDQNSTQQRVVPIWLCALITVVCILAKPSYAIALLPGLAVFVGYHILRRGTVDWPLLILGIMIPVGLVLGLQIIAFRRGEGFIFAPLAVIYSWQRINLDAPNGMEWKFLLSILFPLAVYLLYFRSSIQDLYLNLAWIVFGFGAAYMYLLAEGGERLGHANFTWSTISALYILFIMSAVFLIRRMSEPQIGSVSLTRIRFLQFQHPTAVLLSGVVFGLHVLSGIYWYSIHLTATWMGEIIANKW